MMKAPRRLWLTFAIAATCGCAATPPSPKIALAQDLLDSPDHARLTSALRDLKKAGPEAIPVLTEAAQHPAPSVRQAAALVLGRIGHPDAVPALLGLFDDPDLHTREVAATALGRAGGPRAAAVLSHAVRRGLLEGPPDPVHASTLKALGTASPASCVALVEEAVRSDSQPARTRGLEALKALEPDLTDRVLSALLEREAVPDRLRAVEALAVQTRPHPTPWQRALLDSDPRVKEAATRALSQVHSVYPGIAGPLLLNPEISRELALDVLAQSFGDQGRPLISVCQSFLASAPPDLRRRTLLAQRRFIFRSFDFAGHLQACFTGACEGCAERLAHASRRGDLVTVKKLLDEGVDPNLPRPFANRTALGEALEGRHLEVATVLIDRGADMDCVAGGNCENALYLVGRTGWVEATHLLISRGAGGRERALSLAVQQRNLELVRLYLQAGTAVTHSEHALIAAVAESEVEDALIRELLAAAPARERAELALRVLSAAISADRRGTVRTLLSAGADPNGRAAVAGAPRGRRPTLLMEAAGLGHLEVVNLLIEGGARPEDTDEAGQAAVNYASSVAVARRLGAGAKAGRLTENEPLMQALHKAASSNDLATARVLLEVIEADVGKTPGREHLPTALMLAAGQGHLAMVKLLLERGAQINATVEGESEAEPETALSRAVRGRHQQVANHLRRHGGR